MSSSIVLDKLKQSKERLKENYSSEQLLNVLDALILNGIRACFQCSTYLEHNLIDIASWYSTSRRRKISHLPKEQFIAMVMLMSVSKSATQRFRLFQSLGVERNLSLKLLQDWVELAEKAASYQVSTFTNASAVAKSTQAHFEAQAMISRRSLLWSCVCTVKYWIGVALDFRNQIAEKYMKMVVLETVSYQKSQRGSGARQSTNDVAQNFMMAVYRAIDKCDTNKGTLSAYVQQWINHAKTSNQFRHEVGSAFSVPSGHRKGLATGQSGVANFAVTLSDKDMEEISSGETPQSILERSQDLEELRKLAKAVDPEGYGRLYLGIREVLTNKEVRKLRRQAVDR